VVKDGPLRYFPVFSIHSDIFGNILVTYEGLISPVWN
jgi:hypothetical protein